MRIHSQNSHPAGHFIKITVAAAAWVLTTAPLSLAEEERVVFAFEPDPALVWLQSMEDTRAFDYGGAAPNREQFTTSTVEVRYEPADTDWRVHRTTLDGAMSINGAPLDNPILDEMVGTTMTLTVDGDGHAATCDGARALMRRLERNLDPETYERFAQTQTRKSLEQSEIVQWNGPLRDLIGQEVRTGERWKIVSDYNIGGQYSLTWGVVTFDGWTEIGGRPGYKIIYDMDSTGKLVETSGGEFTRELAWLTDGANAVRTSIVMVGKVVRVIDPATGQMLYESLDVAYDVPIGGPDGDTAHVEEITRYRYRVKEDDAGR